MASNDPKRWGLDGFAIDGFAFFSGWFRVVCSWGHGEAASRNMFLSHTGQAFGFMAWPTYRYHRSTSATP